MTTDQPASGSATPPEPTPPKPSTPESPPPRPAIRGAGTPPQGPSGSRGPQAFSGRIEGAGQAPSGPSGGPGGTTRTGLSGPSGGAAAKSDAADAQTGAAAAAEAGGTSVATVGRFLSEVERARAGLNDDQPAAAGGNTAIATKEREAETAAAAPATAEPDQAEPDQATPGSAKEKPAGSGPAVEAPPPGDAPAGAMPPRERPTVKDPLPTARPPGSPPDPWVAYAATTERAPGRLRRGLRRVGRALRHEYALVTYGALVLAAALTWPTLRYPLHTVPQDVYDPAKQGWQIAWSGHALLTDPAKLWQSNAFYPEHYSFAFGDSLLGYAPAGMLGSGPDIALLRYNILFVLAHALLAIGGYALIRQLGAGRTGAIVAAAAFAYAPWRLAQEGHLDVVSAGGIPLALAMLARGHGWSMRHGFRRDRRHAGWAAAGWLVAAWQISLGFSLGLPFAYALVGFLIVLLIAVPIRWLRRREQRPVLGWRLWTADVLGALIVAFIGLLIAIPYLRALRGGPSSSEVDAFSPPLRSLLIGPAESRIWGGVHEGPRSLLSLPGEMALLPGFVLYALALAGLVFSVWRLWQRAVLLVALAVSVILTLGTNFFDGKWTYLPLFGHLPDSFGVRVPGRLMLWVTLILAILAAGAVADFVRRAEHWAAQRIPPFPGFWLRVATFVPLMLVLAEGLNVTPHPVMPAQPAAMRTVTSPALVLPSDPNVDRLVMQWSTTRFQSVANGGGGFAASQQAEFRTAVDAFPDAASINYLRESGVEAVIVLRDRASGTPWERSGDVPVDALGITREDLDDNTVLFNLKQPQP